MIAVDRLLDANFLISRWRDGEKSSAAKWLRANADLVVGLPWIVKAEFLRGAAVAGHQRREVRELLDRFPVAWPDDGALDLYAAQFAKLCAIKALPGPHDLWIAVSALQVGIPLVTRNTVQFAKIDGLQLESY
ncbi:MAG: type II toxin-antitoxin system VapC family toxin [Chthoniobacterales bacterium]|jgi:predicted nucleic acid-binding protein|nr:type II toxin-antitoxin system VapC family toxin [Chthoniobacterales bacterium]